MEVLTSFPSAPIPLPSRRFLSPFSLNLSFVVVFLALQLCRELERQSLANLHIIGSKLGECMQTAVYRLSERKEGDPKMGNAKYTFKWGTKPVMELSLAAYTKHSTYLWLCFALWICIVLFTFLPLLFY